MKGLAFMIDSVSQEFYVYALAYPDGRVFYVGKGQYHSGLHVDRIDDHEKEALGKYRKTNERKIAAIREIWAQGGQVMKTKVAYFASENDAFMYEWALINMTAYAETLTNIDRKGYSSQPKKSRPNPLPPKPFKHEPIKHWGCFKSPSGHIYHQVQDIRSFASRQKLNPFTLIDIANGKPLPWCKWGLAEECEGKNWRR